MDPQEWMYHTANVLNVLAWLVTDVLWIRTFSVFGNAIALLFYANHLSLYHRNVYWHAAYIVINCVQIAVLLYERRPVTFDEDEEKLYQLVFPKLSRHDYRKLLAFSNWTLAINGAPLTRQGQLLQDIKIIVTGKASVEVDGKQVAQLRDGNFVGEMSFLNGGVANADVKTVGPLTHYVSWNRKELESYLKKSHHIAHVWQHAMGIDLVSKLLVEPKETSTYEN